MTIRQITALAFACAAAAGCVQTMRQFEPMECRGGRPASAVDERTQTISPTADSYTEFHIAKPSGWPKGKYTLHILLDGKEVRTKDVTVK